MLNLKQIAINFKRINWNWSILFVLIFVTFSNSNSEPKITIYSSLDTTSIKHKPFVLVLSGGGARGFAHIGFLRELEKNGIVPDLIVGSSMGAVIGSLYASGYNTYEMESMLKKIDWIEFFTDKPTRKAMFLSKREFEDHGLLTLRIGPGGRPVVPTGLATGHRLFSYMRRLFENAPYQPNPSFDSLKIPIRIVCTDIITGNQVVYEKGDLALACRATVSYPLFFEPVPIDGMLLTDGGISENIPVSIARKYSENKLILSIDCTAPAEQYQKPNAPWEIADRVTTILQQEKNQQSRTLSDILVQPDLKDYTSTTFNGLDSIVVKGEEAGRKLLNELSFQTNVYPKNDKDIVIYGIPLTINELNELEKRADHDEEIYRRLRDYYTTQGWVSGYIKSVDRTDSLNIYSVQPPIVTEIVLEGTSYKWATLAKGETAIKIGNPLTKADLERTVDYLYGSAIFDFVYPVREAVPGGIKLRFIVIERVLPVMRLGLGYDSHRGGSGQVQLLYDNLLGIATHGSLRLLFGERDFQASLKFHADRIYKSIGAADFEVNGMKTEWQQFNRTKLPKIHYDRFGISSSIGQSVKRYSIVSLGIRYQQIKVTQDSYSNFYKVAPLFIKWTLDTEDQTPFPTEGAQITTLIESDQGKWSDATYTRIYFNHSAVIKTGNRWIVGHQILGGFNNHGSPRSEWFRFGGPWDFWGLLTGEEEARNLTMLALNFRYDLISRLVADTYIEARGNVAWISQNEWNWRDHNRLVGGGIGVALSTWIGPMRLVWGWAGEKLEKSTPTVSLSLGSSIPNPIRPRMIFK